MEVRIKDKIQEVVSVFETSSKKPAYDTLVILPDGPGGEKQITYGKHQAAESGQLKDLLKRYCDTYGRYARDIRSYLPKVGQPGSPLIKSQTFLSLLKSAGSDPIMHEVQDRFFDERYWNPAYIWFTRNGFTLPLSMLVVYDSFIHSGGILDFLRKRFEELPPERGGDEKDWIQQYVKARDKWLETSKSETLRFTDYRTDTFLDAIGKNNWDLSQPIICKFNSVHENEWITIS